MKKALLCLLALVVPSTLWAEPNVIYDDIGVSKDITPYYRIFIRTEAVRSASQKIITRLKTPALDTVAGINAQKSWLPINTPELSVAKIDNREAYFPNVPRPLCVIGSDDNSLKWIDKNLQTLIKMNAYCWLVQANTTADLKWVGSHTKGLQVIPARGSVLAKLFGIKHYPLVITGRDIMQ